VDVETELLGILATGGATFSCLTDTVGNLYGVSVPGSPAPGSEELGVPCGANLNEDWGPATAIVAGVKPWQPDSVRVIVPTAGGEHVPLTQLARMEYVRGPQVIKSEDTFLTSYVLFDRRPDVPEVEAVEAAQRIVVDKIASGELRVPDGVSYAFAGSYENQVRGEKRLMVLVPLALALVFILLYLQFHRTVVTLIIYSGAAVAVAGGLCLLWLYAQPGFLHFDVLGVSMQELFRVGPVNMSVAVWIGFLALVGIATDDGVVMATYLKQRFAEEPPRTTEDARERTLDAGVRRVRPCLMTTATTMLALLPVIT